MIWSKRGSSALNNGTEEIALKVQEGGQERILTIENRETALA